MFYIRIYIQLRMKDAPCPKQMLLLILIQTLADLKASQQKVQVPPSPSNSTK